MGFLEEAIEADEKITLESVKFHAAMEIIFEEPSEGHEIPRFFLSGPKYPYVSFACGRFAVDCGIAIVSEEFTLNFYRMLDFLKLHRLELDTLPYDHKIINKYNPFNCHPPPFHNQQSCLPDKLRPEKGTIFYHRKTVYLVRHGYRRKIA